jgi:16S rRNA (cytosine1402-N4)-methyltransferase
MHFPVMLERALDLLEVRPDGVYFDCTCGLAGHTRAIAQRLESGMVIANDRDAESLKLAAGNVEEFAGRVRFHHGAFSEIRNALRENGVGQVDGTLADLGVSRYQLTSAERGFSILADGPLDMRLDRSRGETAADLVNHSAERALADLIYHFGEERRARKLARAIVRARPIRSTAHLAGVLEKAAPRTGSLHPATRTFMALRIAVNREMEELDALLDAAPEITKPGGVIVMISFHSLEDRKVKEKFRELRQERKAEILTKKPEIPSDEEIRRNPPSRSAKLRAIKILDPEAAGAEPAWMLE